MIQMYDYVVIGKGLIGSACARHLCAASKSVAIVGPDEPHDLKQHKGVFSSHYDSTRITRILDTDAVWALLAKRSVERYRDLESQSGITFFQPIGCVKIVPANDWGKMYVAANKQIGRSLNVSFDALQHEDLRTHLPFLTLPFPALGVNESETAGLIDPRKLIAAQLQLAEKQGAAIIRETVVGRETDSSGVSSLITDAGRKIEARKIIVAAGAFSNLNGLLPVPVEFAIRRETVVFAQLSPEQAQQYASMPCAIIFLKSHANLNYVYVIPPVVDPDGNWYMKIGGDRETDEVMSGSDQLSKWFTSDGGVQAAQEYRTVLQELIPSLSAISWSSKPCVITETSTERPYIGKVADGIYVAAGGCGAAAKSSDELGRVAAIYMEQERFDSEFGEKGFQVVFDGGDNLDSDSVRHFQF